jgi:hypothetical protein
MASLTGGIWKNTVAAIYKPSAFVQAREDFSHGFWSKARTAGQLIIFYLLNLGLYMGPLTLEQLDNPEDVLIRAWLEPIAALLTGTLFADLQNGLIGLSALFNNVFGLFLASVFVGFSFHGAVVITRSNNGILQSIHTVVNSTGIYLAGIFTLTVLLSQSDEFQIAEALLLDLQVRVINFWIDLFTLGAPEASRVLKELFPGQVTTPDLDQLSGPGSAVLFVFFLLAIYFAYSIYLGARINHNTGRLDSLLTFVIMALTPGVYVFGLIVWNIYVIGVDVPGGAFPEPGGGIGLFVWNEATLRVVESGVLNTIPMLLGG